ncbi:lysophospholipid acyltransferase family protein [Sulfurisoma sediminicola]|uniref:Lyso-ornithine lipid acyltransferase n=1 Tax=Sulfurisoma sediminicola TaxID=1381557 RepID=A0A497XB08_9PROT|nr:lysophospholipid acyltransferase family protein [Sulfurisoma sediminicola]RLJ63500.1 lyso-ornithine lipid acyltransferase [Sulfurisoma sediminicola]
MLIALRAAARLAGLGLHLALGLAIVALVFPRIAPAHRLKLKRRWSARLLRCLGVELRAVGGDPQGLLVANHISFLDIFVINAVKPVAFVSKDDVRRWPLIGWLAARTDTIFLERGSRAAAQHARGRIVERLRDGRRVAVFPEGTTTRGDRVLPFHGALFQAAIDAGAPVTPLALRYTSRNGRRNDAPAYIDAITLWQCLRAIATAEGLAAQIEVLTPLPPLVADRRHLAAHAHRAIAHAIGAGMDEP